MYWYWLWWNIEVAEPVGRIIDKNAPEFISWYTCTFCSRQNYCEYRFDLYCTDYDCLWIK